MSIKKQWLWIAYCLAIPLLVAKEAYRLFLPGSEINLYYHILCAFDPVFYINYSAYVMRLFMTLIHCIPFLLFTSRIRFLPPTFWQCLFIFRCYFEITGNSYDVAALSAFSHTNPRLAWVAAFIMFSPYIPSYVVSYWYAFRQDKIFTEN